MEVFGTISGSIGVSNGITGSLSPPTTLSGSLIFSSGGVPAVPYEGPYEFTPTEETQTVEIENLTATQDITINPIPSNYGLITWNGITLTVS